MSDYRLTPKQLDHPNWEASTNKSPTTVVASSEVNARREATLKYFKATPRRTGENVRTSPWLNSALVDCTELTE